MCVLKGKLFGLAFNKSKIKLNACQNLAYLPEKDSLVEKKLLRKTDYQK